MENAATDKYAEYGESRLDLIQDLDLVKEKKVIDLRLKPEEGPYLPYMSATIVYNKELRKVKNFHEMFKNLGYALLVLIRESYDQFAVLHLKPSE